MRLLTLADALRDAGVEVVEVQGWKTRGYDFPVKPRVVVGHHTASAPGSKIPSLNILINGRSDLPGPLCQIGLSRDAVAYVVASGKANHAGPGQWKDVTTSSLTVGIEAENSGVGEPWAADQLAAFDTCAAVLLNLLDQPASMYCGHKEWALPTGRKIDPHGIDLDQQRGRINTLLTEGFDMALSDEDKAWIRAEMAKVAGQVASHQIKDGPTVGVGIRTIDRRTQRIAEAVGELAAGDGASAKEIIAELARELGD